MFFHLFKTIMPVPAEHKIFLPLHQDLSKWNTDSAMEWTKVVMEFTYEDCRFAKKVERAMQLQRNSDDQSSSRALAVLQQDVLNDGNAIIINQLQKNKQLVNYYFTARVEYPRKINPHCSLNYAFLFITQVTWNRRDHDEKKIFLYFGNEPRHFRCVYTRVGVDPAELAGQIKAGWNKFLSGDNATMMLDVWRTNFNASSVKGFVGRRLKDIVKECRAAEIACLALALAQTNKRRRLDDGGQTTHEDGAAGAV